MSNCTLFLYVFVHDLHITGNIPCCYMFYKIGAQFLALFLERHMSFLGNMTNLWEYHNNCL